MNRTRTLAHSITIQGAGALLNLAVLPLVARALGPEQFGIVGLCIAFQAVMMVIDGCNLMTRIAAEARLPDKYRNKEAAQLVFLTGEKIYLLVSAGLFVLALILSVTALPSELAASVAVDAHSIAASALLIVASACAKLVSSFYRGAAIGWAEMTYSNWVSLFCYVLRFPAAYICVLIWPSVVVFLAVQMLSFLVEAVLLRARLRSQWHPGSQAATWREGISALRGHEHLIFTTFTMAGLLTVANQIDKFVLASTLPLRAYGAASMAITLCAGAFVAVTPVLQVFLPGLTQAAVRGSLADSRIYFRMMTLLMSLALLLTFLASFATDHLSSLLVSRISEDQAIVRRAFAYYGVGNGLAIVSQGLYWLHFAKGSLRRYRNMALVQLSGYTALLAALSPRFGLDGTGSAWVIGNAALVLMLAFDLRFKESRGNAIVALLGLFAVIGCVGAVALYASAGIAESYGWPAWQGLLAILLGSIALVAGFGTMSVVILERHLIGASA